MHRETEQTLDTYCVEGRKDRVRNVAAYNVVLEENPGLQTPEFAAEI
ncbi:hypothetical protein ACLQ2Q_00190 [Microbacterium sp. DT81.1]